MSGPNVEQHHPRVLLVEDELMVSEMIAEVLEENGFEVSAVATASEALLRLTSDSPFDILFTDIKLPGEFDGATLARLARELRPHLAVVYGSGTLPNMEKLRAVSGSIFLTKPYDPHKLCTLLAQMSASAH